MTAAHILPSQASPTGNYRGVCDWADRPLTYNSIGDTLRISDQGLLLYTWDGSAWANPDVDASAFNPAIPGPIGATTAGNGNFTNLVASVTLSGTGVTARFAAPPDIGGTTPGAGTFTALTGAHVIAPAAGPVAANSPGTKGEIRSGPGFVYICVATDTWEKVATATWA